MPPVLPYPLDKIALTRSAFGTYLPPSGKHETDEPVIAATDMTAQARRIHGSHIDQMGGAGRVSVGVAFRAHNGAGL
jgi:hypothetical protein